MSAAHDEASVHATSTAAHEETAIVARFTNSLAYHRAAQRHALSRSPLRMAYCFLWALWLAYFLAFLLTLSPMRLFSIATLQNVLLLLIGVLFVFNMTPAILVHRSRPVAPLLGAAVTWQFTAARVAGSLGDLEHRDFAWQVLRSIDVLPDGLFIVPNPHMSHWIPRSAFASDTHYEQVVHWAEERANALRRYTGTRGAEWIASLALVPFVLPLFPMALLVALPEVSLPNDFQAVRAAYATASVHFALGFWLIAAIGFSILVWNKLRSAWLYIGVALVPGLLWEYLWPVAVPPGVDGPASLVACGIAWVVAGWLHWWLVVRGPAPHR